MSDRFITVAIHTYDKAISLRNLLESEGIEVEFRNVNIEHPVIASGVRVRIRENDLPLALRIIENREIFSVPTPVAGRQADPTKPILVPVDFSEHSLLALKAAFHLAHRHDTTIELLHTYIDPYVAGNMQLTDSLTYEIADAETRQQVEKTALTQMDHFTRSIRDMIKSGEIPPVKFTTNVVEGVPEDAITEYAKSHNPFMIVMGTRGSGRKERELIGSVTAEVLDKCRFTVLAIPECFNPSAAGYSIKHILFFSNIDQEDILAMDTLYRILPATKACVTIASVPGKKRPFERNPKDGLKALQDYCVRNFKNFSFETENLSLDNIINEYTAIEAHQKIDLIVVPNKKKNIFSRLFNPSLAHRILFSTDIPMLVIPV